MAIAQLSRALLAPLNATSCNVPMPLVLIRCSSSHSHSAHRLFVWGDILRAARSDPEKLHDIVDTLSKHCIAMQVAPPLDSFNDLISICDAHGDLSSIHKLFQMSSAVNMHLDGTTNARLNALWPRYYPAQLSPEDSFISGSSSRGGIGIAPPSPAVDNGPAFSVNGSSNNRGGSSSGPLGGSNGSSGNNSAAPAARGISWSIRGGSSASSGSSNVAPPPSAVGFQQQQQQQQGQQQGQQTVLFGSSSSSSSAGPLQPDNAGATRFTSYGRYGQGGHGRRMSD